MSANPVARPQSRRGLLTAALAGTAASAATFGGHVVLAAVAEPDPIFALIEAENRAHAAIDAVLPRLSSAEEAFYASGFNRPPRVQTGTVTTIVDRDLNPLPMSKWEATPVYAYTREDIERAYGEPVAKPVTVINGDRKVSVSTERHSRLEEALAAWEADEAEIAATRGRCGVSEAEGAFHDACGDHDRALVAVFEGRPTTVAGLLAMVDLFEKRSAWTEHDDLRDDICAGLAASVRAVIGGRA